MTKKVIKLIVAICVLLALVVPVYARGISGGIPYIEMMSPGSVQNQGECEEMGMDALYAGIAPLWNVTHFNNSTIYVGRVLVTPPTPIPLFNGDFVTFHLTASGSHQVEIGISGAHSASERPLGTQFTRHIHVRNAGSFFAYVQNISPSPVRITGTITFNTLWGFDAPIEVIIDGYVNPYETLYLWELTERQEGCEENH
jgi:hypothetical protein